MEARNPCKTSVLVYPMETTETIGDDSGKKYIKTQFSNQNRQDAISRVSAVQNSMRGQM